MLQLTAATPWPVAVRPSPAGGKGLFVTEAVKAGAPLLVDAPLVAAPQGFRSRARALACSACGAHAGGPAAQAAHALLASGRAPGPDVPALLRLVAGLDSLPAGAPQVRGTAAASGGSAPGGGRGGGGGGGGGAWGLASSAPTPCPGGCAHELYCSPACAAADWAACHGAVCGGGGGSGGGDCARAAAADALAAVAAGGNDALWLAGRAAGGCAARASAAVAADPSLSHADALRLAWTPWAMAEKALWWEQPAWPPAAVVGEESESESEEGESGGGRHRHRHRSSPPSSSGDGDGDASGSEAAFRAGLRGLVEEAAAALGVLLRAPPPLPTGEGGGGGGRPRGGAAASSGPPSPPPPRLAPPALAPLASPPILGALVGAFELNNLEVDIPPLAACLEEEEEEAEESAGQHAKRRRGGPPASSWPALRAAAGPASLARAAVSGSAFYPIQACANHSCVPTARAVAGAGTHGLVWVEGCGGGGGGGDPSARPSTSTSSLLPPPLATAPVPAPASALLLAARDLEAGEEVTLCYVREEGGLEERAGGLRDYGIFVCGCARCEREREGGDGGGGGAGEKNAPLPSRPAPGLVRESRGPTSAWVGAWRA